MKLLFWLLLCSVELLALPTVGTRNLVKHLNQDEEQSKYCAHDRIQDVVHVVLLLSLLGSTGRNPVFFNLLGIFNEQARKPTTSFPG